jgi:hypothetical protein
VFTAAVNPKIFDATGPVGMMVISMRKAWRRCGKTTMRRHHRGERIATGVADRRR